MAKKVTPKIHGILGDFKSPDQLLNAVRAARSLGYGKMEAYTPFPIHGIDDAMGAKPSILGYWVILLGTMGLAAATLLIWWTGAVDYPLVISGKPLFAFEFSIPIMFELTVLFSAFAAVFGMLGLNKLPQLYHPVFTYSRFAGATDNRFLLMIEAGENGFDAARARDFLASAGAESVEMIEE